MIWSLVVALATLSSQPQIEADVAHLIQGRLIDAARRPVSDAKILARPEHPDYSPRFEAVTGTDKDGTFRLDLSGFEWSGEPVHVLVLAPGWAPATRILKIEGEGASVEFTLSAQPWRTVDLSLVDLAGHPVVNTEVAIVLDKVIWASYRTDEAGELRFSMPTGIPHTLKINASTFRPTSVWRGYETGEPTSLTVRLCPPISGMVLGPDGEPAPGIRIGRRLSLYGEPKILEFVSDDGKIIKAVTDAAGRFSLDLPLTLNNAGNLVKPVEPLCFGDEALRWLAFHSHDPYAQIGLLKIRLQPSRQVRIPVETTRGEITRDKGPEYSIAPVDGSGAGPLCAVGQLRPVEDRKGMRHGLLEAPLPAGRYVIDIYSHREGLCFPLRVPKGEGPLELSAIELRPTPYQEMIGKPAMEIDAVDLSGRPVRLADFRGKVVILDFWGYWCGPCIRGLGELIDLQKQFPDERVAILALHDASVQSRAQYDQKTSVIRDRLLGIQNLPFFVLLDRPDPEIGAEGDLIGTGRTIKRYGISSFPSTFVIDQDGKLVDEFSHADQLEAAIRKLLE